MNAAIVVGLSIVCCIACLLIMLKITFGAVQKKLDDAILNRFDLREIIGATTKANFFGEKSKGGCQVRGNGALVLTKEELFFIRAAPEKEFSIPVQNITNISLPRSFNGKSILHPLLCVHFRVENKEDAMAWAIKKPQRWQKAIEAVIMSNAAPSAVS